MKMPQFGRSSDTTHYRSNIMSPLNVFVGLVNTALVAGLIGSGDVFVKVSCLMIITFIVVFYGGIYVYFMLKAPDRLQTEEYNVKLKELGLFQEGTLDKKPQITNISADSDTPIFTATTAPPQMSE